MQRGFCVTVSEELLAAWSASFCRSRNDARVCWRASGTAELGRRWWRRWAKLIRMNFRRVEGARWNAFKSKSRYVTYWRQGWTERRAPWRKYRVTRMQITKLRQAILNTADHASALYKVHAYFSFEFRHGVFPRDTRPRVIETPSSPAMLNLYIHDLTCSEICRRESKGEKREERHSMNEKQRERGMKKWLSGLYRHFVA